MRRCATEIQQPHLFGQKERKQSLKQAESMARHFYTGNKTEFGKTGSPSAFGLKEAAMGI